MLKSEESLSAVFKCLGDPGRRAMLVRLSQGEATLGQLAEPLAMSLPAVHQHLAVLEKAGLVTSERRGRERWSQIEPAALARAQEWLSDRCRLWEQRLSGLDDYLADTKRARREPDKKRSDESEQSTKRRRR